MKRRRPTDSAPDHELEQRTSLSHPNEPARRLSVSSTRSTGLSSSEEEPALTIPPHEEQGLPSNPIDTSPAPRKRHPRKPMRLSNGPTQAQTKVPLNVTVRKESSDLFDDHRSIVKKKSGGNVSSINQDSNSEEYKGIDYTLRCLGQGQANSTSPLSSTET